MPNASYDPVQVTPLNAEEVEAMVAAAEAAFAAAGSAAELKQAAKQHGLDLIAIVMGSPHDRNYVEGVLSKDALFIVLVFLIPKRKHVDFMSCAFHGPFV